ncbi:MAG: pilus assembly protein N-terminal domain-containing protein [Planctomycetales bacterium]|nr:pilus assembly protein N-terminal domain-containing protein [Planctomycetales bacterium]
MSINQRNNWVASFTLLGALLLSHSVASFARAQTTPGQPVHFRVTSETQRLEMVVRTSRILTLDNDVPRMLVNNPGIIKATPLSPNQVQLSALQPGVTQVNLWDTKQKLYTVDVVVSADARELENLLATMFPTAQLSVKPLAQSVVISGYVPSPDMISRIHRVAEDYYPNVIDNMKVAGVQTVLLHTKVMEVSRTKLRTAGVDWGLVNGNDFVIQGVSGLISKQASQAGVATGLGGDTVRFGIVDGANNFFGFLELLRKNNLAKVLAEPTLVTTSGRPASFHSGGEFPILIPQSLGTVSVEYRQFGTRVDYVPFVLGNGRVRLEVRPLVSEIDPARSVTLNNVTIPGLRSRWVDTAVEMKAGQTLALAGLLQTRIESENRGIPWLADLPWAGAAFRRVQETNNEIELLILVTPEFADAMDPHEVPCGGPGTNTTSPTDTELYWRGYLEVPNCDPQAGAGVMTNELPPIMQPHQMMPNYGPAMPPASETIPRGQPQMAPPANNTSMRLPAANQQLMTRPSSYQPTYNTGTRTPPAGPPKMTRHPAATTLPGSSQPGLIGQQGYDTLK